MGLTRQTAHSGESAATRGDRPVAVKEVCRNRLKWRIVSIIGGGFSTSIRVAVTGAAWDGTEGRVGPRRSGAAVDTKKLLWSAAGVGANGVKRL